MASQTKLLNDLVEKVSTNLGDGATAERLFAQETAFAALVRSGTQNHRYLPLALATAATAAAACLLFLWSGVFSAEELSFVVGVAKEKGEVGRWEETPLGAVSTFAFAQGSRIDLGEQTAATVATANERRVQVTLRRGTIDTNIVGNGKTEWVVAAGPWRIIVVGTRFTVDWQKDRRFLEVAVTRGKVRVRRADDTDRDVEVSGGQLFRAADGQRIVAPLTASRLRDAASGSELAPRRAGAISDETRPLGTETIATNAAEKNTSPKVKKEGQADADTHVSPKKNDDTPAPTGGRDNRLGWLVHYANGAYDAALKSASKYGIETLIEQLDAVRLWKLQDAARVTRRYDVSAKILQRFRQRFPKARNADVAGFLLGRIAMDKGNLKAAARWFNTYIAEAPTGTLAEEAHGLLIVVYERMGRADMARQAATRYLNRYKGGAFAEIAAAHIGNR